ncbi:hypothetical protein LCGC14_2412710 [marine sediment metagenome]|uniref:Uncharacterized protein n=1 Tax=marine sediment metagenome TaxID=412755 RepID=A0A0F9E473_9ZZZZ
MGNQNYTAVMIRLSIQLPGQPTLSMKHCIDIYESQLSLREAIQQAGEYTLKQLIYKVFDEKDNS